MCSGSEVGSYLRLIDFVYQSILGLRVIKEQEEASVFYSRLESNKEEEEGVVLARARDRPEAVRVRQERVVANLWCE